MPAKIDESCEGCGVCISSCPADIIKKKEGGIIIQDVFCRNCGLCVDSCPVGAISIREED